MSKRERDRGRGLLVVSVEANIYTDSLVVKEEEEENKEK